MPESVARNREAEVNRLAELPPRVFERVRKLLYEKAGIDLRKGKEALVAARLSKRMRETQCRSYESFVDRATEDATGEGLLDLIDALTTNFTSFLREPAHFEFLRSKALPALASRAVVNIWCAAAATGEEPYSIAFTLLDTLGGGTLSTGPLGNGTLGSGQGGGFPSGPGRFRVLATDISTRALERARRGVYPADRFTGVPREWLTRYLEKGTGKAEGFYRVRPEVARMIEFRRVNLVEPFPRALIPSGTFPLIWCRNVMIYFDGAIQQRVVAGLEQSLEPGGHLLVGHSESLSGLRHSLEYVQPAIYRRPRQRP